MYKLKSGIKIIPSKELNYHISKTILDCYLKAQNGNLEDKIYLNQKVNKLSN